MTPYIIGGVAVAVLALWVFVTQRVLAALDETINNAISQIGVQLTGRWDALCALLELTKGYTDYEILSEMIKGRCLVTAGSSAKDAAEQDNLLIQATGRIIAVAEQYPDLMADGRYHQMMDSVNQYKGMARQSRLVYNDEVTKFNRIIRLFPISIIAGIFNFSPREYLEMQEQQPDMPNLQ